MLIELLYPVMPGFAVLFIALNMFQLHFIVNKLARPTSDKPCDQVETGERHGNWSFRVLAPADTTRAGRSGFSVVFAPRPANPSETPPYLPAQAPENPKTPDGKNKPRNSPATIWCELVYVAALFVATVLLFFAVFMLPGARSTATGPLPLDLAQAVFSLLAVSKFYYTPAFISHVWLASVLFIVQAMIKYWLDRRRINANWVCYPVDYKVPQLFESATLLLGLISVLIGIATPQMLGQLR